MLDQRRRRWPNIKPALGYWLVFAAPADKSKHLLLFSSRRHRRWDEGSYGFYLRFFLASSFAYNFVRK